MSGMLIKRLLKVETKKYSSVLTIYQPCVHKNILAYFVENCGKSVRFEVFNTIIRGHAFLKFLLPSSVEK